MIPRSGASFSQSLGPNGATWTLFKPIVIVFEGLFRPDLGPGRAGAGPGPGRTQAGPGRARAGPGLGRARAAAFGRSRKLSLRVDVFGEIFFRK